MTLKQDNPLSAEVEAEIDDVILDLAHQASLIQPGKTINAGMFPEAKQAFTKLLLEQRIEELKGIFQQRATVKLYCGPYVEGVTNSTFAGRLLVLEGQLNQLDKERHE